MFEGNLAPVDIVQGCDILLNIIRRDIGREQQSCRRYARTDYAKELKKYIALLQLIRREVDEHKANFKEN
jgi:hypothetical protein